MEFANGLAPCRLMEPIDVLGDHSPYSALAFEFGELAMSLVRLGIGEYHAVAVEVEELGRMLVEEAPG